MNVFRHTLTTALAVSLLVFALACGDDDVLDGDGDARPDDNQPTSDEDCPDGQVFNPIAEECVADDDDESGESDPDDDEGSDPDDDGGSDSGDDNSDDPPGGGGDDPPPPGECGPGEIQGQTCGPSGDVLINADVTIVGEDCDGEPFEIEGESNEHGFFHLEDVPSGNHTLIVESGQFTGSEPVTITAGETKDLMGAGKKACLAGDSTDIAVLRGSYDDVGSLLDSLQIEYDVVGSDMGGDMDFPLLLGDDDAAEFLSDPAEMNQYNILFIECGGLWGELQDGGFDDLFGGGGGADMDEMKANLRNFVENGNSLYVSDQAQPFVQKVFPEAVDFYQESQGAGGPRQGQTGSVTADVISGQMQALLNSSTTEITFDAPGWSIAEGGSGDTTIHFQGDAPIEGGSVDDAALMVTYDYPNGGNIIFTSFHNNAQASGEMMDILEFMIFQL